MAHRHAIACPRQPPHQLRGSRAAMLRHPPWARCLVDLGTCRHAAFHALSIAMALLHLIACKVPGRGRGEAQLPIQVAQSGKAARERWLPAVLRGFEHSHGPAEMVPIERVRSRNTDVLTQPWLITGALGTGGAGSVGHHGQEGTCDGAIECAALQVVGDEVGAAPSLPQRFQDGERALGSGIDEAPRSGVRPHRCGITGLQDTTGAVSQARRRCGLLGSSALGEHADRRALFGRMPHALGQLKRRDEGAISAFLTGCTHVSVRKNKKVNPSWHAQSTHPCIEGFDAMYRCRSG